MSVSPLIFHRLAHDDDGQWRTMRIAFRQGMLLFSDGAYFPGTLSVTV
jgi:hypothetical protein